MGAPLPDDPKAPPPPPDETRAIFRELARLNTDRQLRRSQGRGRAFLDTGGFQNTSGNKARTGL